MKTHLVTITKRKIFIPSVEDSTINALDRGSDQIHLEYDEEWDGLNIYLILFDESESLVTRYEGEPLIFPDEAYTRADVIPLTVVGLGSDGIIVYRECHGQYDMVRKGERRHYPDAEGPVYEAREDTAYSPDTYPDHWTKLSGEVTL